jgi:hypothetical protein
MLCRVSCEACHIECLWTDDPKSFLESVCLRYRHCQAKLIDEALGERIAAHPVTPTSRYRASRAKAAMGKIPRTSTKPARS